MKILIVDDKIENTYLLESLLGGIGYETVLAKNGAEALKSALNDHFDLIISDILMPVMDGFTFCRECKKENKLKNIPFIFYTATYTDAKDEEFALSLGADKYILKPQDLDVFIKIINEVLKEDKGKKILPKPTPILAEEVVLKEYNTTLIRKLEDKMTQTEDAEKQLRKLYSKLQIEVTEHKHAEDALRDSEEKFRTTFDNASVGMCLTSLDGQFIVVNNALSTMLGYTKEELIGKRFMDFTVKDDIALSLNWMEKMIAGETQTHRFEKRYLHKNGTEVFADINIALIKDSDNTPLFFVTHLVDITDRKLAEKQVILLAHSIKSISECISITDDKDNIIFVNDAFLKTYGYLENELLGKHISIVRPKNNIMLEQFKNILSDTLGGGWKGEVINRKKDGSLFPVLLSTSVIRNENNVPLALIGVATDITESKNMLNELIAAKDRAEEMSRLKSNFMASMSHELRTPLVGLLGVSEFMKNELEGECKEHAEIIHESGLRLLKTITEILNFSKLESEKTEVNLAFVNLTKLLLNEIKLYQNFALEKGIAINENFSLEDILLETDEKLLREIVDNLLSNAVKFTLSGSVTVSLQKSNHEIIISFSDTGIGIPEDKLDLIFEEFRQISEGMSRNFEGTGLGLTIVKKYVNLLNGKIQVASKLGAGSSFTIRLPFKSLNEENKEVDSDKLILNPDAALPENRIFNVLLVEDDYISAFTIEKILKNEYEVYVVHNGPDAIEEAKKRTFDIILMDINLKHDMNGMEAAQFIRKINGYEGIPIVAMTAYTMPGDKEEFLRSGCSHYLAKPFTKFEILTLLKEIKKSVSR